MISQCYRIRQCTYNLNTITDNIHYCFYCVHTITHRGSNRSSRSQGECTCRWTEECVQRNEGLCESTIKVTRWSESINLHRKEFCFWELLFFILAQSSSFLRAHLRHGQAHAVEDFPERNLLDRHLAVCVCVCVNSKVQVGIDKWLFNFWSWK